MGLLGGVEAIWGCQGVLGASRDSRYSGTRRGIGGIRTLGAPMGCRAVWGHQGVSGVYWGLAGTLGTHGLEGV